MQKSDLPWIVVVVTGVIGYIGTKETIEYLAMHKDALAIGVGAVCALVTWLIWQRVK